MQRSIDRILTTHAGALPRPPELQKAFLQRKDAPAEFIDALPAAVAGVVKAQRDAGIDIVNDGEYSKSTWCWYVIERLTGFEFEPANFAELIGGGDRASFPEFYVEAAHTGLWYGDEDRVVADDFSVTPICRAPVGYNPEPLRKDLERFRAALSDAAATEAFLPVVAPSSAEVGTRNEYYNSQEEFVFGLAEALRQEYEAIVDSGFLLQVDDAWLPALWDQMLPDVTLATFRAFAEPRVEALNRALRNIPPEKVRYHVCWGSWHGPHSTDIEMRDLLPIILGINAGAYVFEAANVRHEHEYHLWEDVKLPEGKIIIPGVVSHATNVLEHPELVAERITRFAERVGRENVIAGTDCGLGGRVHPELAWAKLQAMCQGAELATRRLWG